MATAHRSTRTFLLIYSYILHFSDEHTLACPYRHVILLMTLIPKIIQTSGYSNKQLAKE
jgi:hypothetical protein